MSTLAAAARTRLLALHGWACGPGVWDDLCARLHGDFDVDAPALPGYGAGEGRGRAPDRHAVHIGWSLGALHALAAPSAGCRGIVVVAASPRFVTAPDWRHGLDPAVLDRLRALVERDAASAVQRFHALVARAPGGVRKGVLRTLRRSAGAAPAPREVLVRGLAELADIDLRARVRALRIPGLVVLGGGDAIVPPEVARDWRRLRPDWRIEVIDGAGHAPFLTRPEIFDDILSEFLHATLSPVTARAPVAGPAS